MNNIIINAINMFSMYSWIGGVTHINMQVQCTHVNTVLIFTVGGMLAEVTAHRLKKIRRENMFEKLFDIIRINKIISIINMIRVCD
jgi:cytochrome bd-type quinol oxidase subunit 1